MTIQDTYKTKDIFEAAWIHSQNAQLLFMERDGKYFWFNFDNESNCKKLSLDYWSQNAVGNIKVFVNSYKTLKDMLFSQQEGDGQ